MLDLSPVSSIAHTIQLAVTPVFLLTGVGAILAVLTNRLGRIIDRARVLHTRLDTLVGEGAAPLRAELQSLGERGRYIQWAIGLSTLSALLICVVVAVLFLAEFTAVNLIVPIAWTFVAAMSALFLALLSFLREIFLATAHVRIGL